MPRTNLIRTNELPYHISCRSNNQDWFAIPMADVWKISNYVFKETRKIYNFEVYAFVLMSNHYHLLILTPDGNIDKIMHKFNRMFSNEIAKASLRINRMFGGRYKWSIIQSNAYLKLAYRYIAMNPVRANIVNKVENYPFSTFYKRFKSDFPLKVHHPFFNPYSSLFDWLNEDFDIRRDQIVSKCLRKNLFRISQKDLSNFPELSA